MRRGFGAKLYSRKEMMVASRLWLKVKTVIRYSKTDYDGC